MVKRILVTGKNGQLGRSLKKVVIDFPQYNFYFVGRDDIDFNNPAAFYNYFQDKEFDVVINCAAYTAVDKAESEPEIANQVNNIAVKQLAEICAIKNILLIHISTDYVFNGENNKPYKETDLTDPQNVYGLTKLKGEQSIEEIASKAIIIRVSWLYSEFGNNFVKTMLRLGKEKEELNVICDQIGTPTYASDLAEAILSILVSNLVHPPEKKVSVYHFSNEGVCSWYDFAKAIFEFSHIECQVYPIESKDYLTPTKRPYYSLLNKSKIKLNYALTIPYWKDSVKKMLREKNE